MSPASFEVTHRVVSVPPRHGECLGCGEDTTIVAEALTFRGAVQDGPGDKLCARCRDEQAR